MARCPASCAKCHSADGLPFFLAERGQHQPADRPTGCMCATCHSDLASLRLYEVAEVEFPSGATVDSGDPNTNLCMNCHQGRESTASVNRRIGDSCGR